MNVEFDYDKPPIQTGKEWTEQNAASPSTRLTLQDALAASAPLPRHALFLGIATDGLPILLNLSDPAPGSLLIAADAGAGKTTFLQAVALACSFSEVLPNIHFCVLTPRPEEWTILANLPQCMGILSPDDADAPHMLADLSLWAREQRRGDEWMCLLLDDLTIIEVLPAQALQNLRWLLARGPHRGLWPLVTLESTHAKHVAPWLTVFRTRVLGRLSQREQAEALGGTGWHGHLDVGQFALRQGRGWLKFWVPEPDDLGG